MITVGLIFPKKTKIDKGQTSTELTTEQIKEILKENGIEFNEKAKKQELLDLLPKKV